MRTVIQETIDGKTTTTDLSPVERYISKLEAAFANDEFKALSLDEIKSLNERQLQFLVVMLEGKWRYYERLWRSAFTQKHVDLVNDMLKMRQAAKDAGYDLWPELEGKKKELTLPEIQEIQGIDDND